MNLVRLRWLAIVLPLAFLAGLDYVRHIVWSDELYAFPGALVLYGALALGVTAFSFTVFGLIGRLERRILQQNQELMALNRIAAASAKNIEVQDLLTMALDQILDVMSLEAGAICLLDAETEELVASCHRGLSDELADRIRRQKLADDPVGSQVVRTGRTVVIEKIMEHPEVSEVARKEGFRAAISTPLKSEGEAIGVLALATRQDRVFSEPEIELLASIGGQLGLAVRNSVLYARADQRGHELTALLAVARAAVASIELPTLLDEALDVILAATSAETAELWLSDDDGNLSLACVRGVAAPAFREISELKAGEGLPGAALQRGALVVAEDLVTDPRFARAAVLASGFRTYAALPLRYGDVIVGVLAVASSQSDALSSAAERRLLAGIGEQLALSIETARLHQRVLDVAVLEERERIARELHDGVAQVLGYINTQTMALRRLIEINRTDQAQRELVAMEVAARGVYEDVREAILGLRALSQLQAGLPDSLRTYASRFSEMAHVNVDIEVGPDADGNLIPKAAEIQIMRIIQEALTNVRKHADAAKATVRLERQSDCLVASVTDDGKGFDTAMLSTPSPRFGLQTMRERAEGIGGTLKVRSAPGRGTTITVEVPTRVNSSAK